MSEPPIPPDVGARVEAAQHLERTDQALQAELLYLAVLKDMPACTAASQGVARLALRRGDAGRAIEFLERAIGHAPDDATLGTDLAIALVHADRAAAAVTSLQAQLERTPDHAPGWLVLGQLLDGRGDGSAALRAWYEAVTRAAQNGQWKDAATTPPELAGVVNHAKERVRSGRRELFLGAYAELRERYGSRELQRVDKAVEGYLRGGEGVPMGENQRPTFMHFPDLPNTPYHDPTLQPWAQRLQAAFAQIRAEAERVIAEDRELPPFVQPPAGRRMEDYVGGAGDAPAWEAFFFYRHGRRYDANHLRCPQTSAALESIELCRIEEQAPEILFSVLRPGSHIKAHYGVSNVRLVMHLPLIVPPDCALNLVGHGEHAWREGELVMFDDTYLHEAWNRSDRTRVVLLMDCWNPHLSVIERRAVRQLIAVVTGLSKLNPQRRGANDAR